MADPRRTTETLRRLAAEGVTIAVDDFGTGHSSLSYLQHLPVGEIKIDKSFVLSMARVANDEAIVRTVVGLARNLGLPVVAEGVEEEAAAALLRAMGCEVAQGYLYSRPLAPSDLHAWLASHTVRQQQPVDNVRVLPAATAG